MIATAILFIPFAVAIRERCPNGLSIAAYIAQIYGAKTGAIYTCVLRGLGYLSTAVQLLAGATLITNSISGDRLDFFLITLFMAGGTHLLEPMKAIIKGLLESGKEIPEISKQLGMKPEEIFRLSDFSREDFLNMLVGGHKNYSKAYILKDI